MSLGVATEGTPGGTRTRSLRSQDFRRVPADSPHTAPDANSASGVPTSDRTAQPRLLDLFCGAGGAAVGYHRAGFEVIGVDIEPQPHYPFEFVQADAFMALTAMCHGEFGPIAAVHASPVCLTFARVTAWRGRRENHPDTLTPALRWLHTTGLPWVIENVPEAPLRRDYILCGSQFGLNVRRHRVFQTSWGGVQFGSPCNHHRQLLPFIHKGERAYADAMGCDWMTKEEARQAIPPAYTEYLGGLLMEHLTGVAA